MFMYIYMYICMYVGFFIVLPFVYQLQVEVRPPFSACRCKLESVLHAVNEPDMYVCMCVYVYVCMCVCMYVCNYYVYFNEWRSVTTMYVCIYVFIYIFVCMYVCMYVCTLTSCLTVVAFWL